MGDRLDRAIQQPAVVGNDQGGAGKAGQPCLQPHRRFQVEVVGRFVQQQQVRVGEQRRCQRDAHAPAAGKLGDGPSLGGFVEAQARQDGGGSGRGGVGGDGNQPVVHLGEAVRVGGFGFRQQRQPFGVALQDGVEQGHRSLRRFLADGGHAGTRGQADIAAVDGDFAGDGAQQGGFSGAVAADQADAPAGVDRQVGTVQQCAAAHADDGAGDDQKGHERGLAPACAVRKHRL